MPTSAEIREKEVQEALSFARLFDAGRDGRRVAARFPKDPHREPLAVNIAPTDDEDQGDLERLAEACETRRIVHLSISGFSFPAMVTGMEFYVDDETGVKSAAMELRLAGPMEEIRASGSVH